MVQVTKMLLGLAAMVMTSAVFAEQVPAFEVPNFDYETLSTGSTPSDVLTALKKDGIISFTNVPSYAHVRQTYLDSAAACAVSALEVNAQFLLFKTLTDGTNRYTISTPSGQGADPNATTTDAACPGYQAVYTEFSSLLEWVVLSVATTLDATNFTTQDGYGQTISSRKLMTDAVRLDHFHAYETPSLHERRLVTAASGTNASTSSSDNDFSLELHEDDGMFIVFATPAFYKVNSDGTNSTLESVSAGGEDESESGLIIQTRDGQRVRPVLKPDQVTLMVGTGYKRWVATSEQLPAVMHGMRMPEVETTTETQRLLRAWFGKMTLLPSYHRMLKQIDFDVHANTTAHYVQQGHESDRQLLGCAPGRHLMASADAECSYKSCTVKSGASAPSEGCSVVCNRNHATDASDCSSSCTCTTSTHSATTCWMLCVLDLDSCDLDAQSCSGQAKACDSTSALTPTTPAPTSAPTPTTQVPTSAPAPTTPAPTSASTPTTPAPTSAPSPTTSAPTSSNTDFSTPSTATTEPSIDTTSSPSAATGSSEERDSSTDAPETTTTPISSSTSSSTSSTSGSSDSSTPEVASAHGVC